MPPLDWFEADTQRREAEIYESLHGVIQEESEQNLNQTQH